MVDESVKEIQKKLEALNQQLKETPAGEILEEEIPQLHNMS